jgi:phosphoribosylglycinamide formyltransferase-1
MIIVFASGSGTNFEAIANAFPNLVSALVCNVENALVITRAKQRNIPCFVIPHKNYKTKAEHETEIVRSIMQLTGIKTIVLAGYMRVLTKTFFDKISKIKPKPIIINLHPAPLDLYKGAHAYEYAAKNKVTSWGLSIHEVIQELDSGKLLNFIEFPVFPYETANEIQNRVRDLEHKLLIQTLHQILFEENISL